MAVERGGREIGVQRLLERLDAEHAACARPGHRDAHAARRLGDEHADQRVARGGVGELLVGRLLRDREAHLR